MPIIERPTKEPKPGKTKGDEDPLVSIWRSRLERAEKNLKEHGGDPKGGDWGKLIQFFEGEQWPVDSSAGKAYHRVIANQAKANIDAIRPQLYFQNPKVRVQIQNPSLAEQDIPETQPGVDPMTGKPAMVPVMQPGPPDPMTGMPTQVPVIKIPRGTPIARINGELVDAQEQVELIEAVDNYYLDEMRAKETIRRCLNDALVLPYAVCRLEWVVRTEEVEEDDPAMPGQKIKAEKVVEQTPRLTRVKPWCFLWDTELDEFDVEFGASWVAEIRYYSKEELEADPYMKVDFEEVGDAVSYIDQEDDKSDPDHVSEDRKRYKTYEIHDTRNGCFYSWVQGSTSFNRVEKPSYYKSVEGSIYTVLGFDSTINDSFPLAVLKQIKSESEAYNLIISAQVNHVFRNNRKYQVILNGLAPNELEKLETGPDGAVIQTQTQNAIGVIPDAPIPQDSYQVAIALKQLIGEKIGNSAYNRAAREPGVDTAFEASLIQGGSDTKIQEKRDLVREFARRIVRKLNQILKEYADAPTVTKIAGLKGERWVKWSAEDIAGEFLEDVDIYTSAIYSKEVERKQWTELLSIANGNPYVNQQRLWERVFRAYDEGQELLNTPQEMAEMQAAQAQQQQVEEAKRQSATNYRPTEGGTRRGPDMAGGIKGEAMSPGNPERVQ